MKKAVSQETNRLNLRYTAELLNAADIRWFVFFGTLLGLTRDSDVIQGDDDVDIYIDSRDRAELVELLERHGLEPDLVKKPNHTPYFLQVNRAVDGQVGLIDFYLFDGQSKPSVLIDRWNFLAKYDDEAKAIHVPIEIVLPIEQKNLWGTTINFPQKPREVCRWLYGGRWDKPLSKSTEYEMMVIENRPQLAYRLPRKFERFIPKPLRPLARQIFLSEPNDAP